MNGDFRYCASCDLCYHAQDCERDYQGRVVVLMCPVCERETDPVGVEGDDLAILEYLTPTFSGVTL